MLLFSSFIFGQDGMDFVHQTQAIPASDEKRYYTIRLKPRWNILPQDLINPTMTIKNSPE